MTLTFLDARSSHLGYPTKHEFPLDNIITSRRGFASRPQKAENKFTAVPGQRCVAVTQVSETFFPAKISNKRIMADGSTTREKKQGSVMREVIVFEIASGYERDHIEFELGFSSGLNSRCGSDKRRKGVQMLQVETRRRCRRRREG